MNKPAKVILGIATIMPVLHFISFLFFMFLIMPHMMSTAQAQTQEPPKWFPLFFGMQILIMLLSFALLFIYIVNVFTNERVEKDKKALWAVVIFLGSIFSMPVYWYLYIWREPKKKNP